MVLRVVPNEVPSTNTYCANCLQTRRFEDMGTFIACEYCRKRLDKVDQELSLER